jgi:aryl-alcohol dehydrogenase-like predicted oxidoreductase
MNCQLLGKSGLRVSELCLGTMTFGGEWGWGANKNESKIIFDAYVNAGGNFLDTADGYTAGKLSQLEDNLNCVKWPLNAKQLAQLDEVSKIEPGFPTDFLHRPFVRDYLHGGLFDRIQP